MCHTIFMLMTYSIARSMTLSSTHYRIYWNVSLLLTNFGDYKIFILSLNLDELSL